MAETSSPAPTNHGERDAATHTVTGVFLIALGTCVLGGLAYDVLAIDRLLNAAAGGALVLCGAGFLWRARIQRARASR